MYETKMSSRNSHKTNSYGKDGLENVVPDLAGNTETQLKVLVVVCKMVFLHMPQICR